MLEDNLYKLNVSILTRKYAEIVKQFVNFDDDRRLMVNMYNQMIEACKVMEPIENAMVCVAFNNRFDDQEAKMERITSRFTGKVYADFSWKPFDKPVYRVYRMNPAGDFKQECCSMDEEVAVCKLKSDVKIGFTERIIEEHPDGSKWIIEVEDGDIVRRRDGD